jgi:hypothetical protein
MIAAIEPGLPGTGPPPIHLHTGRPTPWSEGCVVRFTPPQGEEWIGNLQTGYGYATEVVEWSEANAVVVIAKGAVYFVHLGQSHEWRFIDLLGINCTIVPTRDIALISTYTDVVAITTDGTETWRRSVAVDGVEITTVKNGKIYGIAGIDPPDEWHPFILELATGNDGEQNHAPKTSESRGQGA